MTSRKLLAFFIVFLLSVAACHTSSSDAPSSRGGGRSGGPAVVPVAVATATRQDVPILLTGLGSVQAYNTVTLRTRIDGQIMAVYFREGQDVHKGQVLALIDPRPYEVALQTARANLARDVAQQKTAQANLARSKALLDAGVVAVQEYQTQEATAGQFNGVVQADQAAIENAKLNLQYTKIISPIDGRIGLRLIDPGNIVHANDQNGMLVVTQLRPIAVVFTLPQEQLPSVLEQSHKGTLKVQAHSSDDLAVLATGKLETVDNQIDPSTGTVRLKAVFDNQEGALWPNQFVNVHLQLFVAKNALTIPAAAVQRGPDGNLIYVMGPDRRISIQPVTIEMTQGNTALISSGLTDGQQVVTEGQDKLQAGTMVSPRPANPAGGAAGPGGARAGGTAPNSGMGGGTSGAQGAQAFAGRTGETAGATYMQNSNAATNGAGSGQWLGGALPQQPQGGPAGANSAPRSGSRGRLPGPQSTPQGVVGDTANPAAARTTTNVGGAR